MGEINLPPLIHFLLYFFLNRNKGLIQSSISAKYSYNSGSLALVSAAICAGLYPNLLQIVIDDQPETINTPSQKSFQLRPPGSREIVKPHHAKSAFANSGPELKRPFWFAYHLMTRVGGGNVAAKLKVWDVNRVGFFPVITFAGSTTKVEVRRLFLNG